MFRNGRMWCVVALGVIGILIGLKTEAAGQDDKKAVPLFNGKDLKNWKTEGNWMVEGSEITLKPRPGESGWQRYNHYLWTGKQYGDFVLDLEYKHPKGGNSGIFVRSKDLKDPVSTGIEIQILDSYGNTKPLTHHDCGGVIKTAAPTKNMAKPFGEWNRMIVTCKGENLQVNLNGTKIIDINLSKGEMKDRPPMGYVGLQDHGEPIWFRNIKIQELK